jgi:hypothetical protein
MKPISAQPNVDELSAIKYLEKMWNTFDLWRYVYETKPVKETSPTFLLHFARAVENYLIKKHGDWKDLAPDRYTDGGVPPLPDNFRAYHR